MTGYVGIGVHPCLSPDSINLFFPGKVMNALRAEHAVDLYRYKAPIFFGISLPSPSFTLFEICYVETMVLFISKKVHLGSFWQIRIHEPLVAFDHFPSLTPHVFMKSGLLISSYHYMIATLCFTPTSNG